MSTVSVHADSVPQKSSPLQGRAASLSKVRKNLVREADPLPLVWLRISFGLTLLYWSLNYLTSDLLTDYYLSPRFHFTYSGFHWVSLPVDYVVPVFVAMAMAAACVTAGLFYRASSCVLGLTFAWVFLSDKTYYQNHYYLLTLIGLLLPLLPCHAMWSMDRWLFSRVRRLPVKAWMVLQVRWYIAIPYFFGGIAKITPDWIAGQPMRTVLASKSWHPVFGPFVGEEWFVLGFVWSGLLFDLLIVPALCWKRTRVAALLAALAFHLLNATTFTIGVFPWLMIAVTPLLIPTDVLRRWLRMRPFSESGKLSTQPFGANLILAFTAITVMVHCLLPFRHHAMPGHVSWNEVGHHFSWRMKLRGKTAAIHFDVFDPVSGAREAGQPQRWLTAFQTNRMSRDPQLVHQFAGFLKQQYAEQGYESVEVRVVLMVSLNGRKPQLLIDPNVDLAALPIGTSPERFVVPLKQPLRFHAWPQERAGWLKLIPEAIADVAHKRDR